LHRQPELPYNLQPMKITIQFEEGDQLTEQGMRFYAARSGYSSIEQYAVDQILCALEGEEEGSRDGYFSSVRKDFHNEIEADKRQIAV
jgi:hypothetical protein